MNEQPEEGKKPESQVTEIDDLKMPEDVPTRHRIRNFLSTHRTRVLIAAGVLIIAPAAIWAYIESTKPAISVSQEVIIKKKPKPTTKASPLTGVEVDPAIADRPIYSVVIENHPNARPQSSLSEAGVVYEALAEGGITRFQAFFLDNQPKEIGPVRSLRTYFVDWALEFNAPVAHVGGNADALDLVGPLKMKDMNQFVHSGSFYRTRDRFAPHNVYTTSERMSELMKRLGYDKPADFKPNARKKDEGTKTPLKPTINIDYSYNGYQVDYNYDSSCNCYLRNMAGAPHIERTTSQQIKVKNVVVQYMPTSYGTTRIGEQTVMMGTPGSGKAVVFRDGGAVEGTWTKTRNNERTKLLDAAGKEIPLNKGNTWFSIVPTTKTVSY